MLPETPMRGGEIWTLLLENIRLEERIILLREKEEDRGLPKQSPYPGGNHDTKNGGAFLTLVAFLDHTFLRDGGVLRGSSIFSFRASKPRLIGGDTIPCEKRSKS